MKCSVIIAAGGQASRLNVPGGKQLMELAGKPVVIRSIQQFQLHPEVREVVIVTAEPSIVRMKELVEDYLLDKVTAIVPSGKTRQHSVKNGLSAIRDADIVLIHDGARPFVTQECISAVIAKLQDSSDGALVGVPVVDTIKQVNPDGLIGKTLDRSKLVAAQTPQGFRMNLLREAYQRADLESFTDDASLVEAAGGRVALVPGDTDNIKITYPTDIILAELILQRKGLK